MLIRVLNKKLLIIMTFILSTVLFSAYCEEMVIEIDNPKFSEKGLDDKVYEIKARKGLKSENELELFVVEGKFKTEKDGKWVYMMAEKGSFSQLSNFIKLEKNIIFYTDEGEKLRSNYATFDITNDIIKLSENVSHESIDALILSDNSTIKDNFNKIIYTGNVISLTTNDN